MPVLRANRAKSTSRRRLGVDGGKMNERAEQGKRGRSDDGRGVEDGGGRAVQVREGGRDIQLRVGLGDRRGSAAADAAGSAAAAR